MLRALRLRLTLLYLAAALALVTLSGGGAYFYLQNYFKGTSDLAMQHKMAFHFNTMKMPLPPDLAEAEKKWYGINNQFKLVENEGEGKEGEHSEDADVETPYYELTDAYDAELASIFTFPLDAEGRAIFNPNAFLPPISPDLDAVKAARQNGSDWRNISQKDGSSIRLFTYHLPNNEGPVFIQLGRSLSDQERTLTRFLWVMAALGAGTILLFVGGAWVLAGRSLEPAQRAYEQQQIFVANASHELRAPLTLIQTTTEVALRHEPEGACRSLLGEILKECGHMNRLVEDLLLLSRLDSHRLSLEPRPIQIPELFEGLRRQVEVLGQQYQSKLNIQASTGQIVADPTRLRQVLTILLDNAMRHNPPGGQIDLIAQPAGKNIRLVVRDYGKGIPPEYLPHLFERFYQIENSRSSENRSNGLGLSIARGLIEAHGGSISVESKVNEGTTFTVLLPVFPGKLN